MTRRICNYKENYWLNDRLVRLHQYGLEAPAPIKKIQLSLKETFNREVRFGRNEAMYLHLQHMKRSRIKGPMFSLAGSRPAETLLLYKNFVRDDFIAAESSGPSYRELKKLYTKINSLYSSSELPYLALEEGKYENIIGYYEDFFAHFDLDEMVHAIPEKISKIIPVIQKAAKRRFTISWAHTMGMSTGNTLEKYYSKTLPVMLAEFIARNHLKPGDHTKVRYNDGGGIPIVVEILTLQKRAA